MKWLMLAIGALLLLSACSTSPDGVELVGAYTDGEVLETDTVTLEFIATDNLDDVLECDVLVDGIVSQSVDTPNGIHTEANVSVAVRLPEYTFQVNCCDDFGGCSSTGILTLFIHDLTPPQVMWDFQ